MIVPDALEMGICRQMRPGVASSMESMGCCGMSETLFA